MTNPQTPAETAGLRPAQAAVSLLVVAWQFRKKGLNWGPAVTTEMVIEGFQRRELVALDDAQAQLDTLRAENDRLTRKLAAARESLSALADLTAESADQLRAERDAAREHLARNEGLLAIAIKSNENADRRAALKAGKEPK